MHQLTLFCSKLCLPLSCLLPKGPNCLVFLNLGMWLRAVLGCQSIQRAACLAVVRSKDSIVGS